MGSVVGNDALPSGMVTFLFTDIEGSTRRWEADAEGMRASLAEHDAVLRAAIEFHGGRLFKHTGDGVVAAFASAQGAVDAAIDAQRRLGLPVRMGMASGEAEADGGDYFGPPLNRAARVMAAGHGGQILVAASTAHLLDAVDLLDLGARRLRDLSEAVQIFQVRAEGLAVSFPPLRTVDVVPGNLPSQATTFIGRDVEVAELVELVRAHRLVTLVGVGGVGKTRLSLQVAAELTPAFPEGVWFVELAPLGDAAALPDLVATTLAVTPQAGMSVTESVARALDGRTLLLVLDNCEHVLDAAADFAETVLGRTGTVSIVATSREALRVSAEHTWPVPSLDVDAGIASEAVSLFVERARAVRHGFVLEQADDVDAAIEICQRLDGIALAIELAAARMVSMGVREVRDRLHDRFRLLAGGRRGLERHQTLRQAVQWSYDLLDEDERLVLASCSVFADGFDLPAIAAVHGGADELAVLDLVDSLVRKSLVTAEQGSDGRTRFGVLETIRQFAEDQALASGSLVALRDRHRDHLTAEVLARWEAWNGPAQRQALDWVDAELANLRAAFRWAVDGGDLASAATIAAHAAIMIWPLQRFEPVAWAEEILPGATGAGVPHLPRLEVAAALCLYMGRPDEGVARAQEAARRTGGPFEPFVDGWSDLLEALAHLFGGRIERRVEICEAMVARPGFARVVGLCGLTWALPAIGRADEARVVAEETLAVARDHGNPFWIGWAFGGYGRAFAETDPVRALAVLRDGLAYAEEHRLAFWAANLAQDAARLEAVHGDRDDALRLFASAIDAFHRAGNIAFLAATLASLAVCFDRLDRPEVAATVYGASTRQASIGLVPDLADAVAHLRAVLGDAAFDEWVAAGVAMETPEAVRYAHQQLRIAGARVG